MQREMMNIIMSSKRALCRSWSWTANISCMLLSAPHRRSIMFAGIERKVSSLCGVRLFKRGKGQRSIPPVHCTCKVRFCQYVPGISVTVKPFTATLCSYIGMGNDPLVDFPAGCWLWGYTQPLQRFSSHLLSDSFWVPKIIFFY